MKPSRKTLKYFWSGEILKPKQPMKLTIIAIMICLAGCEAKRPNCTSETGTHNWTKWEKEDGKSFAGTKWMSRICENCGWRQERGAELP